MAKARSSEKDAPQRGLPLARRAIEAAKQNGLTPEPHPVPAELLARLTLPNGEPLPASLREALAFDAASIDVHIDEEDGEIMTAELEDIIDEAFGEDAIPLFGEAYEILADDCIPLRGDTPSAWQFLYVGNPDKTGEYPVITVSLGDEPLVGGFAPFDVWLAQRFGALPKGERPGAVPEGYESTAVELARKNGDGRVFFTPEPEEDEEE